MSRGAFKAFLGLLVLLVITMGTLTGLGWLFMIAVGGVEDEAQHVAIEALLTMIGLFLTSVGWTQVLMIARRIDSGVDSSS